MTEHLRSRAGQAGVGTALFSCFLTVWTTIVRDDGTGGAYFMLIMAVFVGWFSAGFRHTGMARTMIGVAIMQVLNGLLVATAPVTAHAPGGPLKALLFNAVFAVLWLTSGALFRMAARSGPMRADAA